MRLKLILGQQQQEIKIPTDYRRYFLSFIKNGFSEGGIFQQLYLTKRVKPFTFCVFLGRDFKILEEKEKIKTSLPFNFLFSTGDVILFSCFYNGVLELKKKNKGINLPGIKNIVVKEIYLYPKKKIKNSCCIFKTVGVCILTDSQQKAKDFDSWFCIPDKGNLERFQKILEHRMLEKYQRINGKRLNTQIKFKPISQEDMELFIRQGKLSPSFGLNPIKEIIVRHYNGYLRGFKGVFCIESHPEMLQFIYDYGLGVRTGQGFGMVEVIAQGSWDSEKSYNGLGE